MIDQTERRTLTLHAAANGQAAHPGPPPAARPDDTREALLLDSDEVAALLGVSVRQVRRLSHSSKMPKPIKLGRLVNWNCDDIQAWLALGYPDRRTFEAVQGRSGKRWGRPRCGFAA